MMGFDNSGVRRRDRLLSEEVAMELLESGQYGFLSLAKGDVPYGVPLSYACVADRIYFHCAPEGEKLSFINVGARACFVVVGPTEVQSGSFTTLYRSVMAKGRLCLVSDGNERRYAIGLLLAKYSSDFLETGLKYAEKSLPRTAILRLDIDALSGKGKPGME